LMGRNTFMSGPMVSKRFLFWSRMKQLVDNAQEGMGIKSKIRAKNQ
jgi:hypothetical protein